MKPGSCPARWTPWSRIVWASGLAVLAVCVLLARSAAPSNAAPRPTGSGLPASDSQAAPQTVSADSWTNLFPQLTAVSASSATDAWAVGDYGRVLHYTAGSWLAVDPPALRGFPLSDVQMHGPSVGWIAGGEHAFAYVAGAWVERSAGLGPGFAVTRLSVLAADDVWAIGHYPFNGDQLAPAIFHWDGTRWQVADVPFTPDEVMEGIAFASPTDGWVTGWRYEVDHSAPIVFHWDGQSWSSVPGPPLTGYNSITLSRVAATAPGEIWVLGLADSYTYTGRLYHWHAGLWTSWALPDQNTATDLAFASASDGWIVTSGSIVHWDGTQFAVGYSGRALNGVALTTGQIWAVGAAGTIVGRTGTSPWTLLQGGPTTNSLRGLAALAPDDAWAVGDAGTALHYDGTAWQQVSTPVTMILEAIAFASPSDGYAVGGGPGAFDPGVILHWDGASWIVVARPPARLQALIVLGPGEAWAVGQAGIIWQARGGAWSAVTSPLWGTELLTIAMDSPAHGWAAGGRSGSAMLLEYTNGTWTDRSATVPSYIGFVTDLVFEPDSDEGWATVGSYGGGSGTHLMHIKENTWTPVALALSPSLASSALEALGEAWTVGCTPVYDELSRRIPVAYHYQGGIWQMQPLPTGACPNKIALLLGRGGWAVGGQGTILQYSPLAPGQRFYDVPPAQPFYSYIDYMAAHNIISGYADNTFHPTMPITRAQLTKLIVAGLGWPLVTPMSPTFADVPASDPFYAYVETASSHGIISGYSCGGPGEPCDSQRRPYFRPQRGVTRGQLAKIIVSAKGWAPLTPPTPTFADVPPSQPFFGFVERAVAQGIVSGYACGGPGEPCTPQAQPYFRPGAGATRGQLSKILYLALTQP